ncbi:hypothetical protein SDC9_155482 [bioreactor metagenome]|uniref:Uncharacterized protein n=1 Tax=bioreactor metagenome TaxID=1076179 RepID=A0A645F1P4_9ZZZZ
MKTEKLNRTIYRIYKEWKIPGLAVGVVDENSTKYKHTLGIQSIDQPTDVDENTIFASPPLVRVLLHWPLYNWWNVVFWRWLSMW